MSVDRALLAQYLRQLADLGIDELYLEHMTGHEAVEVMAGRMTMPAMAGAAVSAAVPAVEPVVPDAPAPAPRSAPAVEPRRLQILHDAVAACTACGLHETRSNVVFGEGNEHADVVIVGEAPGQEEDRTGRPFVGRAGKLLDLLLLTAGMPRGDVFICNTLKCRPPQNRNPLPAEVAACSGFLQGQLDAIAPRVLVAVGKFAAQALLGSEESITRLRGTVHSYRGTPLVVTYHPAYLLRSPQMTRHAWHDFQLVRRILDEQPRH